METNAADIESATLWLSNTRFNHIETVVVGCLVMFMENVSIPKGTVNGATTTVQEIECSSNGMVTSITVQFINSEAKMKLKRQTFQYKYTSEAYYYKASFPIVLAYAITGHKSQGATIATNVLIDIQNAFSPGLTYVMLSWVTNQRNLKIKG
jgi:ATP-dependent DNA helicase PIF1